MGYIQRSGHQNSAGVKMNDLTGNVSRYVGQVVRCSCSLSYWLLYSGCRKPTLRRADFRRMNRIMNF
jgi:hypothetical protein